TATASGSSSRRDAADSPSSSGWRRSSPSRSASRSWACSSGSGRDDPRRRKRRGAWTPRCASAFGARRRRSRDADPRRGPAPGPAPPPSPARVVESRSAWRHPATLAAGATLLLAFGIAIGAGVVRYAEPDRSAGAPMPGSLPLTPPSGARAGGGGTPGAPRVVTPAVLQGMLQAARASLSDGRYGEAIAAYQAVLKRDPKNVDALTHLGLIVAIGGHADTALETFERALAIDPKYPPALLYRGQVLYESKKDTAGAIRSWEKFVAVVPPGEDRARVEKMIAEARAKR